MGKLLKFAKKCIPNPMKARIKQQLLKLINVPTDVSNEGGVISPIGNDVLNVAVRIPGGIGDAIIFVAWLTEFHKQMRIPMIFDLFGGDFLHFVAHNHSFIRRVFTVPELYTAYSHYDLKFTICHIITTDYWRPDRIRLFDENEIMTFIEKCNKFSNTHSHYLFNQPHYDGAWADFCVMMGWNRWDELGASGSIVFTRENKAFLDMEPDAYGILDKKNLLGKTYITVHAGMDNSYMLKGNGTRIWPMENWKDFCFLFKKEFPEICIVQIGGSNSQHFPGVDYDMTNKTSLHEAAVLLKHSMLHIDGDSGMVHLASQLGGCRSIALYGTSPLDYLAYPQNINLKSDFCKGTCMWKTTDWWQKCARGFDDPMCMKTIASSTAMSNAKTVIEERLRQEFKFSLENVRLYSQNERAKGEKLIDNICAACNIHRTPVSMHTYGPNGSYIHSSKHWEYPYVISAIESKGGRKIKIADIGGGRGAFTEYMTVQGYDLTTYDVKFHDDPGSNNENLIAEIKREKGYFNYAKTKNLNLQYGSIFNIPVDSGTYDIVTCVSVVEHIRRKEYAIMEMLRVLKPGGSLILTYDIMKDSAEYSDLNRIEIFTPLSISEVLRKLGLDFSIHYTDLEMTKSIDDVCMDKVDIASGLTVGGMIINKSNI